MSVIEIINQIEADNKERHRRPFEALKLEVEEKAKAIYPFMHREIVQAELDELEKQGKIRVGPTCNNFYIRKIL